MRKIERINKYSGRRRRRRCYKKDEHALKSVRIDRFMLLSNEVSSKLAGRSRKRKNKKVWKKKVVHRRRGTSKNLKITKYFVKNTSNAK